MLLSFSVKNFKSFKDEVTLSMLPAQKITDLPYSVLKPKKGVTALPTAVIYGQNASGKTNVISAMDVLRHIVLSGNIQDKKENNNNPLLSAMRFIPNVNEAPDIPTQFSIAFFTENILFAYELHICLGRFNDKTTERKIIHESLMVNEKNIFTRGSDIEMNIAHLGKQYRNKGFNEQAVKNMLSIDNIKQDELFITTFFKSVCSVKMASLFVEWFNYMFDTVIRADETALVPPKRYFESSKVYKNKLMNDAVHIFNNTDDIFNYVMDEEGIIRPYTFFNYVDKDGMYGIPVEIYESLGTERFIDLFPLILQALSKGIVLVVDEFDASIHPSVIMSIIKLFHNPEVNKHGAQLIFNTHNPIFLSADLFRRDEIVFVERNDDTKSSELYKLSDFGTAGKSGVRKTDDYMKHYFIGRYGAIKDIDFTTLFTDYDEEAGEDDGE